MLQLTAEPMDQAEAMLNSVLALPEVQPGKTETDDLKAQLKLRLDVHGQDMKDFIHTHSLNRQIKMHQAVNTVLSGTWTALEEIIRNDQTVKVGGRPVLEFKVVLLELQRQMMGALKQEWIEIGLQIGELVHQTKRLPDECLAVFKDFQAAAKFLAMRLRHARACPCTCTGATWP